MTAHYHVHLDGHTHMNPRYESKQMARLHAGLFAQHGRRAGVMACSEPQCDRSAMTVVETTESQEGEP